MNNSVKNTLISEIKDLQDALTLILSRLENNAAIGKNMVVDANKINNALGRYQALTEEINHD
jgi:hypothetical protein